MQCPNCNGEVPEGKQYCGHCGGRLVIEFDDDAPTMFADEVKDTAVELLTCHSCGAEPPAGSRFCNICGAHLEIVQPAGPCSSCGATVPAGSHFCNTCGTGLSPTPVQTAVPATGPSLNATHQVTERPRLATAIAWINILTGIDGLGIAAGVGLLQGKPWGWWLGVVRASLWLLFLYFTYGV
ncbi:MAG: zinc ribbon domain-containing protein [Chloroflexi bacterium]|nr:zinc ribbon domain-containing protein [Chloroflexota bacterium]